jgi:hypothetical protein
MIEPDIFVRPDSWVNLTEMTVTTLVLVDTNKVQEDLEDEEEEERKGLPV